MINNTLYNSASTPAFKPGLVKPIAPSMTNNNLPLNLNSVSGMGSTPFGNSNTTTSMGNGLVKPAGQNSLNNLSSVKSTPKKSGGTNVAHASGGLTVQQTNPSAPGYLPPPTPGVPDAGGGTADTGGNNTGGTTQGLFPSVAQSLYKTANSSTPEYQAALDQYNKANENLQQLRGNFATRQGIIGNSPIGLSEQGGEQALLQNQEAMKEAALTGEMNASLGAAQTATGQQSTQQQGLGIAGGLAQPQAAQALGVYNPVEGTYGAYGNGQGGSALFNAGSVLGQEKMGEQYPALATSFNQSSQMIDNLKTFIQRNPQINPLDASFGNKVLQALAGQASDPAYQQFGQQITELLNTASPLVGAMGGVTNFKQMIVNSLVNGAQNGQTVQQSLESLRNIMQNKMEQFVSTGQNPGINAPNVTGGSGSSGGNTVFSQNFFSNGQ